MKLFAIIALIGMGISQAGALSAAEARASDTAISMFNAWCFKAGQTSTAIRTNMERDASAPLPFDLTFWDVSLESTELDTPLGIERRCEVAFEGDHTAKAIDALHVQMATPPVFGFEIDLPGTHMAGAETVLIQGRELLKDRVAVVHVGMRDGKTFMAVDRLFTNWKELLQQ